MLERASSTLKAASLLLAGYFLLNIALRLALPHSLELDEAEQSFFSQYLLSGYGPQPPFYNWIQYAIVSVTGISMGALAVPKSLLLFLCYIFYGLAAREALKDQALAAVAMLALIALPQVSYMAQQDLSHSVALLLATALFLYGFFRTLERPSLSSYLLLGIATGIGIISKYNFALMPLAALLAVLPDASWRRRAFDWRMLIAVVVALVIVSPHALWLRDHLALASTGTLEKMIDKDETSAIERIAEGLGSFVLAIIAFAALPVVLFAATFRRDFVAALSAGNRWTRMIERMVAVSLIAIVIIILGTGATHIRERWLNPFLMVLPIYVFLKMQAAGLDISAGLKRFRIVVPVLMVCVLVALGFRVFGAGLIHVYSKPNVPFPMFARQIASRGQPALIVASDMYVAGNLRLQFPDTPVVVPDLPEPGIPGLAATKGPVVIAWRGSKPNDATIPAGFSAALATAGIKLPEINSAALPYFFGRPGDTFALGYSWIENR